MNTIGNQHGGLGEFGRQHKASPFAVRRRGRCGSSAFLALGLAISGVFFVERQASAQDVVANVKVDFRQAANNDAGTCGTGAGHPCGLGHAHWINSIVQESNAEYLEGMSNPQRVVFDDIPATAGNIHTLSFSHQATKGGIHAYDFLTSWDQAIAAAAAASCPLPAGGLLFHLDVDNCGMEIGPPASMEATCTTLKGNCVDVPVPSDTYVDSTDGAYSTRIAEYESVYGPRTIEICGSSTINSASVTVCSHTGPDTGDSDIHYILQWDSASTAIVIKFAGHLSVSGDPLINPLAWGVNQGAGAIAGGPYHFNLKDLGGALTAGAPACTQSDITSLGSQDNQIKGADIQFCTPACCDGSTCTNGLCGNGSACGTATCDDGIACTNDSCDETNNTCFHTPNNAKCNDSNECTFDVCDPTDPGANADGCVFPAVAENTPCTTDGVPCTDDVCQGGVCVHNPDDTACDDLRTCTLDKCVPTGQGADANGCLYNPNHPACDDLIGCTNDSCDPAHPAADAVSGCVNATNDGKCPDDGLFCNGVDVCDSMAGCVDTGDPCGGATPLCCEDSNSCAAECCFDSECDDLLFCTGVETCVGGVCVDGPNPCSADDCDCTNDFCQESTASCVHAPNNAFCDDGNFCNGTEYCDPSAGPGSCCVSPGDPCVAPLQCNEDKNLCVGCLSDDKCPDNTFCDGVETCDETTQMCTTEGTNPCPEDNYTCTVINCLETLDMCETKLIDSTCQDGFACTLNACDPANPLADPVSGCVSTADHGSCDDMNECTDDSCDPTNPAAGPDGCVHTPKPSGTACGNQTAKGICDNPDVCNDMGQCVQNAKPAGTLCRPGGECDPPEFCDGVGKDCPANVCDPAGNSCTDDGNECTDDVCDGLCHCTHPPKPDNTVCTGDGIVCTRDVCLSGLCVHSPEPSTTACGNQTAAGVCDNPDHCDGMGNCESDPVSAGVVCRPAVSACDSIEFCDGTNPDCPPDGCEPAGTLCPDDGDDCTDDECDGLCGCTHTDRCGTPTVACPPDKVFECDAVGAFGEPTVEDLCNESAQAECTEDATPGKLPLEQTIIRTCTYTNYCGRIASCEQRIDIVDTTPPVVTCPADCTLECGAVPCSPSNCDDPSCTCGGEPTCEDNCSPTCSISLTCDVVPKGCTPGPVAGIIPPPKLTVSKTFTSTETAAAVTATGQGNLGTCVQRIEIVDTQPPLLIDCPGPITMCLKNEELPFTEPTCTDICGTCAVTCVRSDGLPLHGPVPEGPITVTCVAADECGNESSCAFDVELSETGECFIVIPTVSEWGLVVLTLLLLTGAKIYFGRRQVEVA